MCKIIDGFPSGASKIIRVFAAASLYYNYSRAEKCFKLEHGSDTHGLHGWNWQVHVCDQNSSNLLISFEIERNYQENCSRLCMANLKINYETDPFFTTWPPI